MNRHVLILSVVATGLALSGCGYRNAAWIGEGSKAHLKTNPSFSWLAGAPHEYFSHGNHSDAKSHSTVRLSNDDWTLEFDAWGINTYVLTATLVDRCSGLIYRSVLPPRVDHGGWIFPEPYGRGRGQFRSDDGQMLDVQWEYDVRKLPPPAE